MKNVDYDPTMYEQDEYGSLYPIDADSRFGVTLDDLREGEGGQ